jgi:hypothetical protein
MGIFVCRLQKRQQKRLLLAMLAVARSGEWVGSCGVDRWLACSSGKVDDWFGSHERTVRWNAEVSDKKFRECERVV